jgi:hypothetical protein
MIRTTRKLRIIFHVQCPVGALLAAPYLCTLSEEHDPSASSPLAVFRLFGKEPSKGDVR